MKTKFPLSIILWCVICTCAIFANAQSTAFTYQGALNNNAGPVSGSYDLTFSLFATNSGGSAIVAPSQLNGVPISNGLFTVTIDFGSSPFDGTARWLEIGVRTNGGGGFTILSPRQQISPTPYAIFASVASGLNGLLPSSQLSGTYTNALVFDNGANSFNGNFSGNFAGNGSGITGVWHTSGDAGTTPPATFLGTIDYQPLVFKVNGTVGQRIVPSASDSPNIIGGSAANVIANNVTGSVIAGGGTAQGVPSPNQISASYSSIGGGMANTIGSDADLSAISGGLGNTAANSYSTIAGGYYNYSAGVVSFIGGGEYNNISPNGNLSFIGSGINNFVDAGRSFISGGSYNSILYGSDNSSAAGYSNTVQSNAFESTISGGEYNVINGTICSIVGGSGNVIQPAANRAFIGAGTLNTNAVVDSSIVAGNHNIISDGSTASFIGSGSGNFIQSNSPSGAIVGGINNQIYNTLFSFIGGGSHNLIQPNNQSGVITGGSDNQIQSGSTYSMIGGGLQNTIQSTSGGSTIGGGEGNTIQSNSGGSTITGGYNNQVLSNAFGASIGGGLINTVGGSFAMIAGGKNNSALGVTSFAAGNGAHAVHDGSFVLADAEAVGGFSSTTSNQFSGRFSGGVFWQTYGAGLFVDGSPVMLLSGIIPAGGLSGTYVNSVNFNNSANSFTGGFIGNGSALTNLSASAIATGTLSLGRLPAQVITNNQSGITLSGGFSGDGSGLTNLNASAIINGTVALQRLPSSVLTNAETGVTLAGNFSGDGANLTNLNANSLAAGTVSLARLPTQVITNNAAAVALTGAFSGDGSNLTNLSASSLASGTVSMTRLPPAVLTNNQTSVSLGGTFTGTATGTISGNGSGLTNVNATTVNGSSDTNFWKINGNAGTTTANYIGTSDGKSLLIKGGFVGINRTTAVTSAEVFGIDSTSSSTALYGGMYANTAGAKPFYGYSINGSGLAYHYVDTADANKWKLNVSNVDRITVTTAGFVGIGTNTTADAMLTVNGTADKPGGGSWGTFSDIRLKKNIQPLHAALDRLLKLQPVTFEYKDPAALHEFSGTQIGMIAQEVEKVFPDWVDTAPNGMKRLNIHGFEALTVAALRELRDDKDAKIAQLEQANAQLLKRLAATEGKSAASDVRIAALEKIVTRLAEKPTELAATQSN